MVNEVLAAMTEVPVDWIHMGEQDVKMRKAIMKVSKESRPCPMIPLNMKEYLATFIKWVARRHGCYGIQEAPHWK